MEEVYEGATTRYMSYLMDGFHRDDFTVEKILTRSTPQGGAATRLKIYMVEGQHRNRDDMPKEPRGRETSPGKTTQRSGY